MDRKACFIGHRNVPDTEVMREKIQGTVEGLIVGERVSVFLFGSRSSFDRLCHDIVTELQKKYPNLQRVIYTCRHERAVLKENKAEEERLLNNVLKVPIKVRDFDGEVESATKYTAGKASYVERNQAMINDSDFCVFYYNEGYLPPRRRSSHQDFSDYQPKSGTALAYAYAIRKEKRIINLYQPS